VKRRFRPLGLSLAILAVFLTLGFFPLIPALFVVLLKAEGHTIDPGESAFWLPSLVGIVVLVLSVFAWIGRPPRARSLFLIASVLAMLVTLYEAIRPARLDFSGGGISGGSLDNAFQSIQLALIPIRLLVLLYTLWYLNRAPARTYFGRPANAVKR